MAKHRRRSSHTKRRKHRGGGIMDSISGAFSSVGDAITGKSSSVPVTAAEQVAEPVAPGVAPAALNAADKMGAPLAAAVPSGVAPEAPSATSTGGRRRRKTRKTKRRRGGKYY